MRSCLLVVPLTLLACAATKSDIDGTTPDKPNTDLAIEQGADAATDHDAVDSVVDGGMDGGGDRFALGIEVPTEVISLGSSWLSPFRAPLRCPEGALVVGLSVAGPDPILLPNQPPLAADQLRLLCDEGIDPDPGYDLPPGWVWHPLQCPQNTVATRFSAQVGPDALDNPRFVRIGVRCSDRQNVADGSASAADLLDAVPPSYGPGGGNDTFEAACPSGTALDGLATAGFSTTDGKLGGLNQIEGLCRAVLKEATKRQLVSLGPVTTTAATALSAFGVPNLTPEPRRCPDGAVVTAVDVAQSFMPGPTPLSDLQITCRRMYEDGQLDAATRDGPPTNAPSTARCLLGWGIQSVEMGPILGDAYDLVGNLSARCVAVPLSPAARVDLEERPGTPPSTPIDTMTLGDPDSTQVGCPEGAVVVGLQLYGPFPDGSGVLGGIALECREVLGES